MALVTCGLTAQDRDLLGTPTLVSIMYLTLTEKGYQSRMFWSWFTIIGYIHCSQYSSDFFVKLNFTDHTPDGMYIIFGAVLSACSA